MDCGLRQKPFRFDVCFFFILTLTRVEKDPNLQSFFLLSPKNHQTSPKPLYLCIIQHQWIVLRFSVEPFPHISHGTTWAATLGFVSLFSTKQFCSKKGPFLSPFDCNAPYIIHILPGLACVVYNSISFPVGPFYCSKCGTKCVRVWFSIPRPRKRISCSPNISKDKWLTTPIPDYSTN